MTIQTIPQVAKELGKSEDTIKRMIDGMGVELAKIGKAYAVPLDVKERLQAKIRRQLIADRIARMKRKA